jgi:hypothetical protein
MKVETVLDAAHLPADVETIDSLARLRLYGPVVLCRASVELLALIAFCGLDEVLRVEPRR